MSDQLDIVLSKFEAIQKGKLEDFFEKAIDSQAPEMEEMNRRQLDQGLKSDGTRLPAYAPRTKKIKAILGQQTAPMNLRDTGSFQDHIKAKKYGKFLELQSDDVKEGKLVETYGEAILGLTEENEARIGEAALEEVNKELKNFLAL